MQAQTRHYCTVRARAVNEQRRAGHQGSSPQRASYSGVASKPLRAVCCTGFSARLPHSWVYIAKNRQKRDSKNSWNRRIILVHATVWQILNVNRRLPETEVIWIWRNFNGKLVKSLCANLWFGGFLTFGATVYRRGSAAGGRARRETSLQLVQWQPRRFWLVRVGGLYSLLHGNLAMFSFLIELWRVKILPALGKEKDGSKNELQAKHCWCRRQD